MPSKGLSRVIRLPLNGGHTRVSDEWFESLSEFVVRATSEELVAGFGTMSLLPDLRLATLDFAEAAVSRLEFDGEYVRAATIALAYGMKFTAELAICHGLEVHPDEDDPARGELIRMGSVILQSRRTPQSRKPRRRKGSR